MGGFHKGGHQVDVAFAGVGALALARELKLAVYVLIEFGDVLLDCSRRASCISSTKLTHQERSVVEGQTPAATTHAKPAAKG